MLINYEKKKKVIDVEWRAIFEYIDTCTGLLRVVYVATRLLDCVLSFSYAILIFL